MMSQKLLFIFNHAAYGSEYVFNGLRLAITLKEQHPTTDIKLFFLSDAVTATLSNQAPREGYNLQQMLEILLAQHTEILLCKTCCDSRGIHDALLIDGVKIGTLMDLSSWTLAADKILTF